MLEAKNLQKSYPVRQGWSKTTVNAVCGANLSIEEGAVYAIVGESGSGKSTLAQMLVGLLPPTAGEILLDGKSITARAGRRDKQLSAQLQMVLQDGKSSLDPRYTVYDSIAEPIRNLLDVSRHEERRMVLELMEHMELSGKLTVRRPHELSGGQQKRVCIARAIAVSPRLIVFDEAVSGLDVIVRKNILDLLKALQKERPCTYLFITHDIDVALYMADRILVMKDGEFVEQVSYAGDTGCFTHPYSCRLLESTLPGDESAVHSVLPLYA